MVDLVRARLADTIASDLVVDGTVTFTGDDIAIVMSHTRGAGVADIHGFAWDSFLAATAIARESGLYGAGQGLLVDAPSGNIRGAGPAVAEIEIERDPASRHRPAEAFLVFAGDKCSPGAYNDPLYATFCDPMHNGGLLLSPTLHKGFTLTIIDMDHRGTDRVIRLDVPERGWDVACLLQNPDRFAVEAIHSRAYHFAADRVDVFGNPAWDATRLKVQTKADEWRRQGFVGPTMASHAELAYTGIVDTLAALDREFGLRKAAQ